MPVAASDFLNFWNACHYFKIVQQWSDLKKGPGGGFLIRGQPAGCRAIPAAFRLTPSGTIGRNYSAFFGVGSGRGELDFFLKKEAFSKLLSWTGASRPTFRMHRMLHL